MGDVESGKRKHLIIVCIHSRDTLDRAQMRKIGVRLDGE
jgi:hypothetical protein